MEHDHMCKLDSLIDSFIGSFYCEIESKGLEGTDMAEACAVADIIKDLTEAKKNCKSAEKNCQEARYYSLISEAMEESSEMSSYGMSIHGKQRAHVSAWMHDKSAYEDDMHDRMGYTESHKQDRYGKAYHDYMKSKHSYMESHSQTDKDEMEMHVNEHLMDTMTTIKEIAKGVDPEMRKRIKSDLTRLVGDIPG